MNKKNQDIDASIIKVLQQSQKGFKDTYSFEERCNYPGVLPISCQLQNYIGGKRLCFRVYIGQDLLTGHFRHFVKKLMKMRFKQLGKSDNVLLLVGDDVIIKYDIPLKEIYSKRVEEDGWLYIKISIES